MMEHRPSMLWGLSGGLLLIFAVASGTVLSGAFSALAFLFGAGEGIRVAVAITALLFGFFAGIVIGWRDLALLSRRNVGQLPFRWIPGSLLTMFAAAPFWSLCVVHYQERLTGSGAVRLGFDAVEYVLAGGLFLPLAIGVPVLLMRLRRRGFMATEQDIRAGQD